MFISVDAAKPDVWLSPMKPISEGSPEEEIEAFALKNRQPCTIPRAVSLFITQKCFEPKWVEAGQVSSKRNLTFVLLVSLVLFVLLVNKNRINSTNQTNTTKMNYHSG